MQARKTAAGPRPAAGPPGWGRTSMGAALGLAALAALALASCRTPFTQAQLLAQSCADRRLEAAGVSFADAKAKFAEHFKVRADTSLRFAFYASVDSVRLARSVARCFDFDFAHRVVAVELIRSNRRLRRLIRQNLRDRDPQMAIGVFGDEYREIFRNDIN